MVKKIKDKIIDWFLNDYKRELEVKYIKDIASFSINDLVRKQLKGINPKTFEKEHTIEEEFKEETELKEFLGKIKEIGDNKQVQVLIDFLIRDQVLFSAKEANSVEQLNFGRATINGLVLFREEVDRLTGIYLDKTTIDSGYNPFNAVKEE